jgi:hypothetical protein
MRVMMEILGFKSCMPFRSASCQEESSSTTGSSGARVSTKLRGLTVMLPPSLAFG